MSSIAWFLLAIVAQENPDLWVPPTCASIQMSNPMFGKYMEFNLPANAPEVRQGGAFDYDTNVVCLGKSCMTHGWGPLWGGVVPPSGFLSGLAYVHERDIEYRPIDRLQGKEYRAQRSDGTFMRWVGVFGESISYDYAPKEAADFFDSIIDTLCWQYSFKP